MRHLKWIVLFAIVLSFVMVPAASAAPAAQYGTCGFWYPVRWGETLFSIGRVTGVSAWAIAQANGLANPNYVQAGSSLWIPCQTPPPPPPPQCGYWYTVRWGDTLNSIGYRTGINIWAIVQANGIYNPNRIYAGQALWIPCP